MEAASAVEMRCGSVSQDQRPFAAGDRRCQRGSELDWPVGGTQNIPT